MKRTVRWLVLSALAFSFSVLSLSTTSSAQIGVGISVRIGPPALPVYAQPICPGPGYLWTPGYWAWSDDGGYYWVPGTWVIAPVGMLWTPGYWGWGGGFYAWHPGYWGRHVGFYGGINYGFGYGGIGFFGGEWRGGAFFYNRSVVNVNVRNVTNVYSRTVVVNNTRNVSFNGPGGIEARASREEEEYSRESHRGALATQTEHEHAASRNRQLFAATNHGRPDIAATERPGDFHGRNVERAKAAGEQYRDPKISPREARVQAAGNRDSNNGERGRSSDREMTRTENHDAHNDRPVTRGQMASRENPNPVRQERAAQQQERQAQKEQKQAEHRAQAEQKRAEKANREQVKAEQKRNGHEQHR